MGLIPERQVLKKNSPLSVQGTDNGEFGGDRRVDPVFRGPPLAGCGTTGKMLVQRRAGRVRRWLWDRHWRSRSSVCRAGCTGH